VPRPARQARPSHSVLETAERDVGERGGQYRSEDSHEGLVPDGAYAVIDCIVRLMKPQRGEVVQDPAAGTAGCQRRWQGRSTPGGRAAATIPA
jgi:hypothetical protein